MSRAPSMCPPHLSFGRTRCDPPMIVATSGGVGADIVPMYVAFMFLHIVAAIARHVTRDLDVNMPKKTRRNGSRSLDEIARRMPSNDIHSLSPQLPNTRRIYAMIAILRLKKLVKGILSAKFGLSSGNGENPVYNRYSKKKTNDERCIA
ncbi:uncharacterized protein LOC116843108 [Odontomachus brunneus]|uniref:uncharacterized protein LOC116843108 n=1 Tax=Odontomachus brunneus TaxID=486640 RepID=UPI0013F1E60E|nr:uncharacterized protein LOC116843108 [Odontomachus brunneus]